MQLIDIGANLTHEAFNDDREQVIARAGEAGVDRMVLTGADLASSRAAVTLAGERPAHFRATAGTHPHMADAAPADLADQLRTLAREPAVTAIGEAGLDFNRDLSPRAIQERVFEQQLAVAAETGLPVFAHQRDAHERFMALLRPWREQLNAIVVHCFTGTEAELDDYLALDCHIGLTGWLCDERRGRNLRSFIHKIPTERLMVETDAPYLLPRDLEPKPKSRRNEPSYLPHIASRIAQARGEAPETLAATTTATAERFFAFD